MDEALRDSYFDLSGSRSGNNAQLHEDLAELEAKVGQKWLTSYEQLNEDEER